MKKLTTAVNFDGKIQTDRWYEYSGTGNFVALATSATVYHDFREILSIQLTYQGADSGDGGGLAYSGVTQNSNGSLKPTTAGQITVNREIGIDDATAFSVTIKGR
jgi:hypothetical protein